MRVMQETEQKRPRLRRLGDKLGAWYTPIALLLAIGTWAATQESHRFLAVLVVATPCPLLIAIPVAVIGAISLSARRGIIIKNPGVLEEIDRCRTLIFDKTGTLTYGKPKLSEIKCADVTRITTACELGHGLAIARGISGPVARHASCSAGIVRTRAPFHTIHAAFLEPRLTRR